MSQENKPKYTRREIIKNVMIGGVLTVIVLPRKWTRPIVETVVTPAHAAGSAHPTKGPSIKTTGVPTTSLRTTPVLPTPVP
ncbi:MAG: hypothetical protein GY789_02560 [Hyphomicrobiales bacterium]|nr:hypothetical protein [Hyphomicrobiales bacterium]MCP4997855.1 hypothetical protein [Hyphomicrobiales bacterium]